MESTQAIYIKRINVDKLFGVFTYNIEISEYKKDENLIILYGDNGSGKTTILKLLFYLISCKDQSGHKSEISKTKFKSFSVTLSNEVTISAIRTDSSFGTFKYVIYERNKKLYEITLPALEEGEYSVRLENDSKEGKYYLNMLKYIAGMNIKLSFLSDTRKSLNPELQDIDDLRSSFRRRHEIEYYLHENRIISKKQGGESTTELINTAIKSLESYFKSEALKASNVGDQETSNIYLQIVRQVTRTSKNEEGLITTKIEDIKSILDEVHKRTNSYSRFGLVSTTEYSQINQALSAAGEKREVIFNILEPFIRGLKAKLDALQNIQRQLSSFTGSINSFLSYKELKYSVQEGFKIFQSNTDEEINFNDLSSGEKQLVLLFSNAILASSQATIFIIDEPEISLNIKWQRKLLEYLKQITPSNNIQYILATHSIELISSQKQSVVKLENI